MNASIIINGTNAQPVNVSGPGCRYGFFELELSI